MATNYYKDICAAYGIIKKFDPEGRDPDASKRLAEKWNELIDVINDITMNDVWVSGYNAAKEHIGKKEDEK